MTRAQGAHVLGSLSVYWRASAVKVVTAMASIAAALPLPPLPFATHRRLSASDLEKAQAALAAQAAERARVEEALRTRAAQQAAVAELGRAALAGTELSGLMEQVVSTVMTTLGVSHARVMEASPDLGHLVMRVGGGWKGLAGQARFEGGPASQAGYTLTVNEPVIVEDFRAETRFACAPMILEHQITSSASVVIHGHDRPFGVLAADSRARRAFTQDDVFFLQAAANVLGTAIERRRAEDERATLIRAETARAEAETAKQRAAFLAGASRALASSLDYQTTLTTVLRVSVPFLADWATVDLLDEDGRFTRLPVVHADPAKTSLATELQERYVPDRSGPPTLLDVIARGEPALVPLVNDAELRSRARDENHLRVLRGLGIASLMVVPLIARGRTLGAMSFVRADASRAYGAADLAIAEDLAARAALAIDTARLYRAEQEARVAQQRARSEAEEANRTKDEFLATLSHELRTPLTAMLGWARMLQTGELDARATARGLEAIERNTRLQTQLIEDLLDVSRIIAGKLRLDIRLVDPRAIVSAAVDAVQSAADAKGITLQVHADAAVSTIFGDADRLQQVVWNLLSNAIKFTPTGGRVEVRLERTARELRVQVSDTGRGIDPGLLPHIFERFRQAESTGARSGLGLGLAIARHLVELHGGTVEAHSGGRDQGATFTVTLPIAAVRPETGRSTERRRAAGRPVARPSEAAALHGVRVLVVDDEEDARDLVSTVLAQCGAHVITADSVAEAIRAVEQSAPDVLVSDIGMPGQTGLDLIRAVRSRPADAGGRTPAVALTAYARGEDRIRVLAAGFQMHMAKPVEPAELATVVANLAGRSAMATR